MDDVQHLRYTLMTPLDNIPTSDQPRTYGPSDMLGPSAILGRSSLLDPWGQISVRTTTCDWNKRSYRGYREQ